MVTAAHVTHGSYFEQEPERITLSFSNTLQQETAVELRWFEEEDLALLQLEKPAGFQWQKDFVGDQSELHAKVRFYGDNFLIMNGGELIDVRDNRRLRFMSSAVFPGISGSPLVAQDGIIGMITDDSRENATALSIQRIQDMLKLPNGESPYFLTNNIPGLDDFIKVNGFSFEMGDQFKEGDRHELPVHMVLVDDFMMGPTEITNMELAEFLNAEGNKNVNGDSWYNLKDKSARIELVDGRFQVKSDFLLHPATCFSWYGAVNYCNWRSKQDGLQPVYTIRGNGVQVNVNWSANGYRLPTEAEWEFAAREGGRKVRFGNGQNIARSTEMNFNASGILKKPYSEGGVFRNLTEPVNSLNQNALGFYHMAGNVREWCWDWYDKEYYIKSNGNRHPKGPTTGRLRTVRGCAFGSIPADCRVSFRGWLHPSVRYGDVGFRLVKNTK